MPKIKRSGRSSGPGFYRSFEMKIILIIVMTAVTAAALVFAVMTIQNNQTRLAAMRNRISDAGGYAVQRVSLDAFRAVSGAEDMDSAVCREQRQALRDIQSAAGMNRLYTVRRDGDGNLIYHIDSGDPDSADFRSCGLALENGLDADIEEVMETGRVYVARDAKDAGGGPAYAGIWPIRDEAGAVIGVLVLEYSAENQSRLDFQALVFSMVITAAAVFVMLLIFTTIYKGVSSPFQRKMTYTDFLSGLNNRTAFELDFRKRRDDPDAAGDAIVLFDLNNLKMVNDIFGHKWGDEYIKCAANIIQGTFIRDGEAYRIGGDEFVMLLRKADAETVAERLRTVFTDASLDIRQSGDADDPTAYFDIAYGMAVYDPARHASLSDALDEADQAMYVMKKEMKQQASPSPDSESGDAPG